MRLIDADKKWLDKRKIELGYNGCRNCKNKIDYRRTCEWIGRGGDAVLLLHLICPNWERKEE